MEEKKVSLLRCKSSTDANKLAGSIYSAHKEEPESVITLRVIGAGALNQAVKATIISNKFFAKKGITLTLQPSFQDADNNMTAVEMRILFIRN